MLKIVHAFIALAITLGLLLCGLCYQYFSTKRDEVLYPMPGKLIDIDGYKQHVFCTGEGGPTVVLDAGLGANLSWWSLVQKDVSKFATVCSFDRAGYGWSDSGKNPRTSEQIVKELNSLLHATADTPQPYILVGHSFGGLNMRLYANTFPDEVFGLVFVDSCHEKQYQNSEKKEQAVDPLSLIDRCKNYILNSSFVHYIGFSRWRMATALRPYFSSLMPQELRNLIIAKASSIKSLKVCDNEMDFLGESLKQVQRSKNSLAEKSLIVISAGKTKGDLLWMECQKELMQLSLFGKQIIAVKSGHMINVEQPEIIVEAIYELINLYNEQIN